MIRLCVRGPLDFKDYSFVKSTLDRLTAKAKNIILISDQRIGYESHISPSSFPLAEKWFAGMWLKNRLFEMPGHRYSTIVRHCAPFSGDKQWSKGRAIKYRNMIQDSTHLIAFWDVGGMDRETEEMIRLALIYDLHVDKVLI